MRKIKTNFGTLYVEFFNNREEEDRIKIFDSNKRYLDYFCIEYLEEHAKMNNCTKSQQLNKYLNGLKQCSGVKNALHYLGVCYVKEFNGEFKKNDAVNLINEAKNKYNGSEKKCSSNDKVSKNIKVENMFD